MGSKKKQIEQPELFDSRKYMVFEEKRIKHRGGTIVLDDAVRRMLHGEKKDDKD